MLSKNSARGRGDTVLTAWLILRARRGTFMSEGLSPSAVAPRSSLGSNRGKRPGRSELVSLFIVQRVPEGHRLGYTDRRTEWDVSLGIESGVTGRVTLWSPARYTRSQWEVSIQSPICAFGCSLGFGPFCARYCGAHSVDIFVTVQPKREYRHPKRR